MEKVKVSFTMESSLDNTYAEDIMHCLTMNRDGEEVELLARERIPDSVTEETLPEFDEECYKRLSTEIYRQAKAANVDPDSLIFWWNELPQIDDDLAPWD